MNIQKTIRHYLAAAVYFLLCLFLWHMAGRYSDFFIRHPEFFGLNVPPVAWLGPVLYYYLALSLELERLMVKRFLVELSLVLITTLTLPNKRRLVSAAYPGAYVFIPRSPL